MVQKAQLVLPALKVPPEQMVLMVRMVPMAQLVLPVLKVPQVQME
jgi:hypothetical protein